jgi:hypothetical protein
MVTGTGHTDINKLVCQWDKYLSVWGIMWKSDFSMDYNTGYAGFMYDQSEINLSKRAIVMGAS